MTTSPDRYQHTVAFRLRHPSGSDGEAAFLDHARATLSAIPGVEEFVVHRQVSAKSELTWQFSMEFADVEAYRAYDAHPDHIAVVEEHWVSDVDAFQELDFVRR